MDIGVGLDGLLGLPFAELRALGRDAEAAKISEHALTLEADHATGTHLIWLAWDADSRGVAGCSVFVDGQQEAHFDCPSIVHRVEGTEQNVGYFFAHAENTAEMGADGVLTFFVPVEKAVKRIRVIPPGNTNLARFAAIAQEQVGAQDQAEQESTRSN